jgi:hypothetical protein
MLPSVQVLTRLSSLCPSPLCPPEHARVFKARPVPRAVLEARFASATPPNLLYYDDDETDR